MRLKVKDWLSLLLRLQKLWCFHWINHLCMFTVKLVFFNLQTLPNFLTSFFTIPTHVLNSTTLMMQVTSHYNTALSTVCVCLLRHTAMSLLNDRRYVSNRKLATTCPYNWLLVYIVYTFTLHSHISRVLPSQEGLAQSVGSCPVSRVLPSQEGLVQWVGSCPVSRVLPSQGGGLAQSGRSRPVSTLQKILG